MALLHYSEIRVGVDRCFHCGKTFGKKDAHVTWWQGRDSDILLHPACAIFMAENIARDTRTAQRLSGPHGGDDPIPGGFTIPGGLNLVSLADVESEAPRCPLCDSLIGPAS